MERLDPLPTPHGGELVDLYLSPEAAEREKSRATDLRSWTLTPRQLCDVELLLNGGFSPLTGFLRRAEYESVRDHGRLPDGVLWPIPITLAVNQGLADQLGTGHALALRDGEGVLVAVLEVEDLWLPHKATEAVQVFARDDPGHPGVAALHGSGEVYLGGELRGVAPPTHYDFNTLRESPLAMRRRLASLGWHDVVGFHPYGPMHRREVAQTLEALESAEAKLLVHGAVGESPWAGHPRWVGHYTLVRCLEAVMEAYPSPTATLSVCPLASCGAGPREALWHAIVRKNFGCRRFIVVPDHGSPGIEVGNDIGVDAGSDDDARNAAFAFCHDHQAELGIEILAGPDMAYAPAQKRFRPLGELVAHARRSPRETPKGGGQDDAGLETPVNEEAIHEVETVHFSPRELHQHLELGEPVPDWFSYPEVMAELSAAFPPLRERGFTVFFTGLSGAGKSTVANALRVKLLARGGRRVTLLDGDQVRQNLSSELGFSREHRDLNIQRIGFVAAEITKHGGIAICAPIAPYAALRARVRSMVSAAGGFVEVYLSTPMEVCEARDRKGLYAKARAGLIKGFTGVDDPYEVPTNPELDVNTGTLSPEEAAEEVMRALERLGYLVSNPDL